MVNIKVRVPYCVAKVTRQGDLLNLKKLTHNVQATIFG